MFSWLSDSPSSPTYPLMYSPTPLPFTHTQSLSLSLSLSLSYTHTQHTNTGSLQCVVCLVSATRMSGQLSPTPIFPVRLTIVSSRCYWLCCLYIRIYRPSCSSSLIHQRTSPTRSISMLPRRKTRKTWEVT